MYELIQIADPKHRESPGETGLRTHQGHAIAELSTELLEPTTSEQQPAIFEGIPELA